jgi:3-oxoacyl-[acyl-carrier protein] reductase
MTRESMSQAIKDYWIQYCPVGRMGDLPEIAHTVMFLASKHAAFINGQTIPLTGGLDWAP